MNMDMLEHDLTSISRATSFLDDMEVEIRRSDEDQAGRLAFLSSTIATLAARAKGDIRQMEEKRAATTARLPDVVGNPAVCAAINAMEDVAVRLHGWLVALVALDTTSGLTAEEVNEARGDLIAEAFKTSRELRALF